MSLKLRILLIIGIVFYAVIIVVSIRKRKIALKYALLWLISIVVLAIMAIFPNPIISLSGVIGFEAPINAVFLIFIFIILLILISLTMIVTKQHQQIKKLTQSIALMGKEIEDLKNKDDYDQFFEKCV